MFDQNFFDKLEDYCNKGYIRKSKHPVLPLTIYNYTEKTTWEGKWDNITTNTRGLVIDHTQKPSVFIQGPKKFFNIGEKFAPTLDLQNCIISEKLDGYYISIKQDSVFGLVTTSRGSFCNKYTLSAEKLITNEIRGQIQQNTEYFCELLQNFEEDSNIIVTRHPNPKLVCWAMRVNGQEVIPNPTNCPFEIAKKFTFNQAKKYLTQEVEGVVAFNQSTGDRVKIKTEWFLNMHRMISDCSPNRVWELNSKGGRVEDLDIPDEFMNQMQQWQKTLDDKIYVETKRLYKIFDKYSNLSDKELGLSKIDSYDKTQIYNLRKGRIRTFSDKIYLKYKSNFYEIEDNH